MQAQAAAPQHRPSLAGPCLESPPLQRPARITFSAPGINPSIEEAARALSDAGLLGEFCTTMVMPESGIALQMARYADRILKLNLSGHLQRRSVSGIPAGSIVSFPFWELARTVLSRIGADGRLCDVVFDRGIRTFDRSVARRLRRSNAVYGYEYGAFSTFHAAKRLGHFCIYEVPSLEHDFVERLIDREVEGLDAHADMSRDYVRGRQSERTQRRRAEWAMVDLIIVHSNFARDSYRDAGLPVDKVRVLPLGCPVPDRTSAAGGGQAGEPLRILWAGNFSVLKGAHHFLRSLRAFGATRDIEVNVFGRNLLPAKLMVLLPDRVKLNGTIPRAELLREYARADVLMFPTLCDAFGMVLTEALSQGLPVITTPRAGAADFIRSGENGLIVPPGDADALTGAIRWCMDNRDRLKAMRASALETAASWQWADYRAALVREVTHALARA